MLEIIGTSKLSTLIRRNGGMWRHRRVLLMLLYIYRHQWLCIYNPNFSQYIWYYLAGAKLYPSIVLTATISRNHQFTDDGCRSVGRGRAIPRLSSQLPWTLLVPFSHPHLKTTRFAFGAFRITELLPYSSTPMRCFVSPSPRMASTFSAEERMQWSKSGQYLHWRAFLRTRNQMRVLFIFRPSFISFSSRLCCGRMPRRNKWQIMWVPIPCLSSRILILNLDAKAQQSDCDACFQPSLLPRNLIMLDADPHHQHNSPWCMHKRRLAHCWQAVDARYRYTGPRISTTTLPTTSSLLRSCRKCRKWRG